MPEPGSSSRCSASHASARRLVGQPDHAQVQRLAVEPAAQHQHLVGVARPRAASCSATSAVTRAFAVAVVASTGIPSGRSASSVRMRR